MSDSLWPHGLQNARLHCPSLSLGVCLNLCSLIQWRHPTISSSVTPFSSCLQSFLASGSFPVSQLFASGGQRIGTSASALVLPMNIQGWFPLRLTGFISLSLLITWNNFSSLWLLSDLQNTLLSSSCLLNYLLVLPGKKLSTPNI